MVVFSLDIMVPTINQLVHSGVLEESIFSSQLCTADNKQFFSKRGSKDGKFGSMLAIIALHELHFNCSSAIKV